MKKEKKVATVFSIVRSTERNFMVTPQQIN